VTFVSRFLDHFNDASIGLQLDLGNGSVTEPAGTSLRLSCPIGVNCEWFNAVHNSPVAYAEFDGYETTPRGILKIETRMTSVVRSGGDTFPGIVIWADRANAYRMGWIASSSTIHVNRSVGDVSFGIVSSGAVGDPSTTPHVYRIYWNPTSQAGSTDEGFAIGPGQILFVYSEDDGATFTLLHTQTAEFTPTRFGIYNYNYSSLPSIDADFDYLQLSQQDEDSIVSEENSDLLDAKGGAEDAYAILDAGGAVQHQHTYGAGLKVPGPSEQPLAADADGIGPIDRGSIEDAYSLLDAGGAAQHQHTYGAGLRVPGPPSQPLATDSDGIGPFDKAGVEDAYSFFLSGEPDYAVSTTDAYGHPHFTTYKAYRAYYYDATAPGEYWHNPGPTFDGYGRDGYEYASGAKVAAVPTAPWAIESESDDRGPRTDFPEKALIVIASDELVIFDLADFPADLNVWMRFDVGGAGSFLLLGRVSESLRDVTMRNGVLYVVSRFNGIENGGLFAIDFKAAGQDFLSLVRADNHWQGVAGRDITDRNATGNFTTTGVSPSLRIDPESPVSVDAYGDGTTDWAVVAGEDPGPQMIEFSGNVGQFDYTAVRTESDDTDLDDFDSDVRQAVFDEAGWLWFSIRDTVFTSLRDYQQGVMVYGQQGFHPGTRAAKLRYVQLKTPHGDPLVVTHLAAVGKKIYAGTAVGVYEIDRGTMAAHLAYTVPDYKGGGKDDNPPDGELLAGDNPAVSGLRGFSEATSGYLEVSTGYVARGEGAVTLIRLLDDAVLFGSTFTAASDGYNYGSGLREGGAFFHISFRS